VSAADIILARPPSVEGVTIPCERCLPAKLGATSEPRGLAHLGGCGSDTQDADSKGWNRHELRRHRLPEIGGKVVGS